MNAPLRSTEDAAETAGSGTARTALLLAAGASFLAFLDVTITNLAIPDVHRDFPHPLATLSWIVTAYTVLFAALLAPAGRLADVVGRRRLFVVGTALFSAASLSAALAPSLGVLLAARAVQGAGAALVMPASLAFVLIDTPPARRLAAIGIWSAAASAAAAVGPALGGILVETWGWRSLFAINVPLGAWLAWRAARLPSRTDSASPRALPDAIGVVALVGGVGGITLGLGQGQSWGWDSARTWWVLAGGVVALGVALRRSSSHPRPAVETRLWRNRTYAMANVVSMLFGASLYVLLLAGVLLLVTVWHYSELTAGLAMTPGALTSTLVGVSLSRLARRPSPRTLVAGGGLAIAASTVGVALWVSDTPHYLALWLPCALVLGLGIGAVSVGVSSAAALAAPPTSFAGATGLNIAARQVGGAVGLALLTACLAAGSTPTGLSAYRGVYWIAAVSAAAVAVCGAGLSPPVPSPAADRVRSGSSAR